MNRKSIVFAAIIALPISTAALASESLSYAYDPLGRLIGVVSATSAVTATSIYRHDEADNRSFLAVAKEDATERPVFRFYTSAFGHFYTTTFMEGTGAGLDPQIVAFSLYKASGAGRILLYRCYNAPDADHFISTSSTCEGQTTEGPLGYAATSSGTGLVQLYRYYKGVSKDHLITVNTAEAVAAGYTLEFSLGYVPS